MACAVLMFGGSYWYTHLEGIGSRAGLVMGGLGGVPFMPLWLATTFFGRPRRLIPPAARDIQAPATRLLKRWKGRGKHDG
jgi:hypothetical protein